MSPLRINVLGPVEATGDVGAIELGSPRQQAVLALLIANANFVVSTDRLIHELWNGEPPPKATHSLQTYISNLRRILRAAEPDAPGERITTIRPGYRIHLDVDELDVVSFEELAATGSAMLGADTAGAATTLRDALELWHGEPYAGIGEDLPTLVAERARLDELRLTTLERRITADLQLGRHDSLVAELERLVTDHPLREGLWASLMKALHGSGRQSEALRAYQRARRILGEELGIEPSPELQQLEEQILLQDEELRRTRRPDPVQKNMLPRPLTPFIGREQDLQRVQQAVADHRLVTVTGPGGIGKTRLAIEAAATVADDFPGGVYFVDLGPVPEARLVSQAVREGLGLAEKQHEDPEGSIRAFLRERRCLLVLDNCEHVVAEAARLAWDWISETDGVGVLGTSQELLGVDGEQAIRLEALPTDSRNAPSDAARLFLARAEKTGTKGYGRDDLEAVDEICVRLDGVPLAIELAAARTGVLTPRQITDRLEDRFALLAADRRAGLARHHTLREALNWSYALLAPYEQIVFDRLAVMSGTFDLDAAEAVASGGPVAQADVLDLVASLVRHSLVGRAEAESSARYRLLESMRDFGREHLDAKGELQQARAGHAAYFTALAESLAPRLVGEASTSAVVRLEADLNNLRAAFQWAIAAEPETALRLNRALSSFWAWRHHHEGAAWCRRLLERDLPDRSARIDLLAIGGWLAYLSGEQRRGETLASQSITEAGNAKVPPSPVALAIRGQVATLDNRPEEALEYCERALETARMIDEADRSPIPGRPMVGFTEVFLGVAYIGLGRRKEAEVALRHALDEAVERGDRRNEANARFLLGGAVGPRDPDVGVAEVRRAIAEIEELEIEFDLPLAKTVLSTNLYLAGDFAGCIAAAVDACEVALQTGDIRTLAFGLEILAFHLGRSGLSTEAAELYAAGDSRRAETGHIRGFAAQVQSREKALAHLRRALGDGGFAAAWERGAALGPEASVERARQAVTKLGTRHE